MSALFDDAERFEALIVVGDTVRHTSDATDGHVGPGTYSPRLANSKEFGTIGVSSSTRSSMDPPLSPRSSEYHRCATGSVLRDGVVVHTLPQRSGPGPGAYSPRVISNEYVRGRTAKPSSGVVGRQAWDLRGSVGGTPLTSVRGGMTVSSSMGNSPRMADFSQVTLRNGVLLLRGGTEDGHRSSGVGPGAYHGVANRQDPMTKRSYNIRAQSSQVRRERSLSFSGTSSSARAFISLQKPPPDLLSAKAGRPDLHLVTRYPDPSAARGRGPGLASTFPGAGDRRCVSPASALLSSMRERCARGGISETDDGCVQQAAVGRRSGHRSTRSVSPNCSGPRGGWPSPLFSRTTGSPRESRAGGGGSSRQNPPSDIHSPHLLLPYASRYSSSRPSRRCKTEAADVAAVSFAPTSSAFSSTAEVKRRSRSMSPRPSSSSGTVVSVAAPSGGRIVTMGSSSPSRGRQPTRASSASPRGRRNSGDRPSSARLIRFRPARLTDNNDNNINKNDNGPWNMTHKSNATGIAVNGGDGGGGSGDEKVCASYAYDYFGVDGSRDAWTGLKAGAAARTEAGVIDHTPGSANGKADTKQEGADQPAEEPSAIRSGGDEGRGAGTLAVPKSRAPEGATLNGVCDLSQDRHEDMHKFSVYP